MKKEKVKKITSIGGQALIEGIMMMGPDKIAVSGRTSDDQVYVEHIEKNFLKDKYKIFNIPILRGIAGIIDSLKVGYKALMLSAEKAGLEDADQEPSKFDKWLDETFGDKITKVIMSISSVLGIALSIILFFWFPTWIYNKYIEIFKISNDLMIYRSIFEGIFRIIIFILYIFICSNIGEMKRVFQYHGAEHKTIFCYESEENLTVENVKKHIRFHPRCGTSFLVIMLLVGILVGIFIPFTNPVLRSIVKILCIPIIVGLGYELIKICGKYDNIITRIIAVPGLWVQRITTKEPDDKMIEVAIIALKEVIPKNGEDVIKKNDIE